MPDKEPRAGETWVDRKLGRRVTVISVGMARWRPFEWKIVDFVEEFEFEPEAPSTEAMDKCDS
jgi:hypothetical protein